MTSAVRMWRGPFSLCPLEELERGKRRAFLSKSVALGWFAVGIAGGFGAISVSTLGLIEPTPVSRDALASTPMLGALLAICLFTTALFGHKQWRYYFAKSGVGKEGLFAETIGMVNHMEKTLDGVLSLMGGLLLASSALPTVWFLVLGLYNAFVVARSLAVLARPSLRKWLVKRGVQAPPRYAQSHACEHNGLWVPAVLWGWVVVHGMAASLGVGVYAWLLCTHSESASERVLFVVVAVAFLTLMSRPSYRLGRAISNRRGANDAL